MMLNIVPTIGNNDPIEKHEVLIDNLISASSNMVRCCVSKATFEEHVQAIEYVKNGFKKRTTKDLLLMLDIACPKDKKRIWIESEIHISNGDIVYICNNKGEFTDNKRIVVDFDSTLFKIGDEVCLGDSDLILTVSKLINNCLECVADNECMLKPGMSIASKYGFIKITDKEIKDKCIKLIKSFKPDCIVLSYVQTSDDVIEFKKIFQYEQYNPTIMSKIECYSAVKNLNSIIDVSDEIMIARGCLAVNVGLDNLLFTQDITLAKCIEKNKECYMASNILKSLSSSFTPTRSDICDISHMIKHGLSNIVITDSISRSAQYKYLLKYIQKVEHVYN